MSRGAEQRPINDHFARWRSVVLSSVGRNGGGGTIAAHGLACLSLKSPEGWADIQRKVLS